MCGRSSHWLVNIFGYVYTMKTKRHTIQLRERVIEKYKSGDGYKIISKELNIPWNLVRSIIKIWKEYGTCVNLASAGRAHKLSDRARRKLVREVTKTPVTTLKELKASAAEKGDTLQTASVAQLLHLSKLYGRVAKKKPTLKKTRITVCTGTFSITILYCTWTLRVLS